MNVLLDAFAWLGDGANWTGPSGVLNRAIQHLLLSVGVVLVACAVALPVGIYVGHRRRFRTTVVLITGGARALPTLGLLTLLGLALGIGLAATFWALIALALPSVLAGAYAGVEAVDRSVVDGARATGMTELQIITKVELPIAAPVIVGGIRAAFLQVISTATLAAYIADWGFGRFIFAGLSVRQYDVVLAGALLVALLAILVEVAFSFVQRAAARRATPQSANDTADVTSAPHTEPGLRPTVSAGHAQPKDGHDSPYERT